MAMSIRKNDQVVVRAGKDRGLAQFRPLGG